MELDEQSYKLKLLKELEIKQELEKRKRLNNKNKILIKYIFCKSSNASGTKFNAGYLIIL